MITHPIFFLPCREDAGFGSHADSTDRWRSSCGVVFGINNNAGHRGGLYHLERIQVQVKCCKQSGQKLQAEYLSYCLWILHVRAHDIYKPLHTHSSWFCLIPLVSSHAEIYHETIYKTKRATFNVVVQDQPSKHKYMQSNQNVKSG